MDARECWVPSSDAWHDWRKIISKFSEERVRWLHTWTTERTYQHIRWAAVQDPFATSRVIWNCLSPSKGASVSYQTIRKLLHELRPWTWQPPTDIPLSAPNKASVAFANGQTNDIRYFKEIYVYVKNYKWLVKMTCLAAPCKKFNNLIYDKNN